MTTTKALPMQPDSFADLPRWSFGGGGTLADELGALVVAGAKTATCSTLAEYEETGEPIPRPGLSVVVDQYDQSLCVIETTDVLIQPVSSVDAEFARAEGEGDLSLAYWRAAHEDFFASQGRTLRDDTLLVCEWFRLVHVFDPQTLEKS